MIDKDPLYPRSLEEFWYISINGVLVLYTIYTTFVSKGIKNVQKWHKD
ncbi:hypothetical protein H6G91_26180 [Nostoc muscorum FACHB-395]|nr:hypothetical protein [Desmonostoc muscorum FACHB-395]